ncbi:hypothetical protein [Nesterenkonia alba]|uniref:hypothetical protein n=1 Tax=Nesterenkonia alba TaxID=515814 RepID=UPI0003B33845|nr:hypothetical protein [Nesterenkonia alba]
MGGGTSRRSARWRRVRAGVAAGGVLGLGAALSLAAWTETTYTEAEVVSGNFLTEGALQISDVHDGGWRSSSDDGPLPMVMLGESEGMEPYDTAMARAWVRLDPLSPASAESWRLDLDDIQVETPNAEHISYEVYVDPATYSNRNLGCAGNMSQHGSQTELLAGGERLGSIERETPDGLEVPAGEVRRICIRFEAAPGLVPNDEIEMNVVFSGVIGD